MTGQDWWPLLEYLDEHGVTEASVATAVCVFFFVAIPFSILAAMGDRQRREAGGTWLRLILVSLAGTAIAGLPFLMGVIASLTFLYPVDSVTSNAQGFVLGCSLILSFIASFGVVSYFLPPYGSPQDSEPLPLVNDPAFLQRMSQVASRMKLTLPTIRFFPSSSAIQEAQAWVGGLPQPSVVVSNGVLHRLEPVEQEATAAHELAHIANGSLWVYSAFLPIACAFGTLAMACAVSTWMWMVPAFYVGLWRILSRRTELDCDLRAARAIGFPEVAAKLLKIHVINGAYREMAWNWVWSAFQSHPSAESRIAYLIRKTPISDQTRMPQIDGNGVSGIAIESRLAWIGFFVWSLSLAVAWRLGQIRRYDTFFTSIGLLTSVSLAPMLINHVVAWKNGGSLWPTISWSTPITSLTGFLFLILAGFLFLSYDREETAFSVAPVLWWVPFLIGLILFLWPILRLEQTRHFDQAWKRGDLSQVISIADRTPRWLRRDPHRRYLVAYAKAALGQRQQALAELEQLDTEGFFYHDYMTTRVVIQIEEEQYEAARLTLKRMKEVWPDSGIAEAIEARILRKTSRLEEARQMAAKALELNPKYGAMWAAAAGIEVELGDYDQARQFLAKAQELDPNSPQELAEGARLSLKTEPPSVARAKLQRAIAAYESNPLILRPSEIVALKKLLDSLDAVSFEDVMSAD